MKPGDIVKPGDVMNPRIC